MSDATARDWWWAWFAVWSPPVAWVGSIAVLLVGGQVARWSVAVSGLAIGAVGLVGVFVVVPGALGALLATLDAPHATARERTRLAWLSLLGVLFSLIGYGGLLVLGGFAVMLSPFEGIQH